MIRVARLLLLVLTMALALPGVGVVRTGSADPQPSGVNWLRALEKMEPAQRHTGIGVNAVEGTSAPTATWLGDGSALALFQIFPEETTMQPVLAFKLWTQDSGWQGWFNLEAPAAGLDATAPSATFATDGSRLDIFARGASDAHLYQLTVNPDGTTSPWTDLGGVLITAPSATSTTGGRIDVFVVGADLRLYQKFWLGSSWSDWHGFGQRPAAGLGSAPSATWANSGRLDVFVKGATDGALYQLFWQASSGWSPGWTNLGGVLVSPPAASWTNNGGRVDVVGVGTDFRLYLKTWISSVGWFNWIGFAPPDAGVDELGPGTTWVANGSRIDIVVSGATDGIVYQRFWTPATGWVGWVNLG